MWHGDYMGTRAKRHPQVNRAELAKRIEKDRGYVTRILNGTQEASLPVAIAIFQITGLKFGPISAATPQDIRAMSRALGVAA